MLAYAVTGAQWGDEGKGKIVDLLADRMDAVVRFQGGNNAGHTIVMGGKKHILHSIPSGIFHSGVHCHIGNGVVLDPEEFLTEVEGLRTHGLTVTPERLSIAPRTNLIMDYHRTLDKVRELAREEVSRIGTTGRGIGPAYEDKVARIAIRAVDLLNPDTLEKKIAQVAREKNIILKHLYGCAEKDLIDAHATAQKYSAIGERIAPFIVTDEQAFGDRLAGKKVLFEGAQGAMLDLDFGTYPFVTSSNTVSSYAFVGSGLNPGTFVENIAVMKAYSTRVGGGPFPTWDAGEAGRTMVQRGMEYGATTGRERRCGWLDLVALSHAFRVNHFTAIALTKLDVLSVFSSLPVAVSYRINGKETFSFPAESNLLLQIEPVYREMKGWGRDISSARKFSDLPSEARAYIALIEEYLSTPVALVSVGPDRDQTISVREVR